MGDELQEKVELEKWSSVFLRHVLHCESICEASGYLEGTAHRSRDKFFLGNVHPARVIGIGTST